MAPRHSVFALMALGLAPAPWVSSAPVPKGATQVNVEEVKKRVYRCWKEVYRESAAGVQADPQDLFGFEFTPNGWQTWCRRGELAGLGKGPTVELRVDATANPMRIDFFTTDDQGGKKKVLVTPGIFRFEKENLVIVTSTIGYESPRDDGEYLTRPTSFTRTKENQYQVQVLVPCDLLDQDR
jgi:uncharacterized protein (TIGR03067 family)